MKLNNNEATLLAKEVQDQLKKTNSFDVPAATISKIKAYKEKYEALKAAEIKVSAALEKHEDTWNDIVSVGGIYASDSVPRILQKLKEGNIPTIGQIKDKITLKGLFNKDEDMETFIESVVKEFSKKQKIVALK